MAVETKPELRKSGRANNNGQCYNLILLLQKCGTQKLA